MKNKIKSLLLLPCLALVFGVAATPAIANESNTSSLVELERTLKQLQERIKILKNAQPLTQSVSVNYPVLIYSGNKFVNGSTTVATMAEANIVCKEFRTSQSKNERSGVWCAWKGINFTKPGPLLVQIDETKTDIVTDDAKGDSEANFKVKVDATAFYGDLYIPKKVFRGSRLNNDSHNFLILNSDSVIERKGEAIATIVSSADTETVSGTQYYLIREGETESITLEVAYKPAVTGDYRMRLQQASYLFKNIKLGKRPLPVDDYSTDFGSLVGNEQ